jgi:Domain of Unknown Function (DUF1080)
MSRRLRVIVPAVAVAAALAVPAAAQQSADAAAKKPTAGQNATGWIDLFDGKSLEGWRGYKKSDANGTRWRVENGTLTLPPASGADTKGALDIISKEKFERFELTWEWKASQGANSGVKYFVLEDMDAAIGHEYQIIDDERHADAKIGPKRQTAALYDVLPASNRPVKPAGDWNQSRVIVRGPEVEHWLNGTKVLTYRLDSDELKKAIADSKFKTVERFGKLHNGHILLQDHGDQVSYRNIRIRRLPATSTQAQGRD